ncbi:hypothetical protein [Acrocarpospora sp. B8E8]|uniref:MmyB family transcriptional regulator n=1 Tax=Acrocarpospora sp. B8E8 TaxID=3153572 RepID=UPI00325D303C
MDLTRGRHPRDEHQDDQHPDVGPLALDCDVLTVPGTDLRLVVYTAPPGSNAADKLRLLDVIGTQSMTADGHF